MNEKIDPVLLLRLGKPDEVLPVIVIATKDARLEQLKRLTKLRIKGNLRIIHAVAGEVRAGDVSRLLKNYSSKGTLREAPRGRCERTADAPGWDIQLRIAGVPDSGGPSASSDPATGGRGARAAVAPLRWYLRERGRSAVGSAGAAVAGAAVAGAVHDPERAPADRADRLQPAVPLVRGPGAGRGGVQRHGVHQESGTAAHGRDRPALLRGGAGAGRVGGVGVLGALHGGRDADRGVGEPEELRAQGREAEGRRRPGQPDGQLPGREAEQPDPCVDDGPGRPDWRG